MVKRRVQNVTQLGHILLPIFILLSTLVLPVGNIHTVQPVNAQATTSFTPPSEPPHRVLDLVAENLREAIPKPINCAVDACVALTFDDGPDGEITPKVLDILEQKSVKATFFIIGNKITGHEALLRRELNDGHEIGNHTWDHKDLTHLTNLQIDAEINQTNQAVVAAGLPAPQLFRPPYGDINWREYNDIPLAVIMWNVDPKDWHNEEPNADVSQIMNAVQAGSIVILHDTHAATATALPKLLENLRQRNFKLVTVSKLLELQPGARGFYHGR